MEIKRARAFVHGISAVAVHTTPRAAREASRLLIALRPTHEARARAAMAIIDLLQPKGEDAMPPGVMLSAHIVAKGVEFGAVIGLAIGLVACLPVTGGRFKVRRVMEVVEYTVSLCTVIAGVQLLNKARSIDAEGIRERSYRLQHMDPDKARVDVAFIVGGTAVSLLFAANAFQEWVGSTVVERMVRGFAFGGALGFISTAGGVERIWKFLNKTLVME